MEEYSMDKKICKNCGLEFDPDDAKENNLCLSNRYHPQEAVHVGTADSRYDYSEVYKYPCCGQLEFPESPSAPPAPGCVDGIHIAA
jgi:hypothetical protein